MSGEAGPSGSGRGDGGAGRGGPKKPKFMPTVPARRKKGDAAAAGGVSAADAAAINEEFKDLIKAAETGSTWQRGRGRGRGSAGGRGGAAQGFQVTFGGGSSDRPSLPDAKPVRYYAGPGGGGPPRPGGAHVKSETKPGGERGVKTGDQGVEAGGEDGDEPMPDPMMFIKPEKKFDITKALDYTQYYPTTLPIRGLGEELEEEEEGDGPPVPKDLAVTADVVTNAAEDLGLLSLQEEDPPLYLVQLPAVLPISAASRAAAMAAAAAAAAGASADGDGATPAAAAAAKARAAAAPSSASTEKGCSLKELPSGQIGRLLVFKSGKVKLQMGEVLLDVSSGLPCQHRMDVAAINCQAGHCVLLGDVTKRMVVSPDIWQLMEDRAVPDFQFGPKPSKGANGAGHEDGAEPMQADSEEGGEGGEGEQAADGEADGEAGAMDGDMDGDDPAY